MTEKQFASATESAEQILNAFADELGEPADWTQAYCTWFSGSFLMHITYPPGTRKAKLKWLLAARRELAKETRSKWLFIIHRRPPLTDQQIMWEYQEKIEKHGGGIDISDVDEGVEGL